METILVVEDEEPISELIKMTLMMYGYNIIQAFTGTEGLKLINGGGLDLIILDIMLPKVDGYEILPYAVEKGIPVIFLSAKDQLNDKIKGLGMGADDYITKPFEVLELVARVKSVLRRAGKVTIEKQFDDITLDYECRKVFKAGREIELTLKEFELLKVLMDNRGIALSREKLLEIVWEFDYEGNTRTVDMHIQRLRNKLATERIKTVYKVGYRLEA